jgi:AcrR family transcriptional regulator
MVERGVQGTTLAAVARRAGVARATVYLRWPTRSALIGAAARVAVGGQPLVLSGDLDADIRTGSAFIQRIFELPAFPAMLPEIVRGVLAHPPELSFDSVAPRRKDLTRLYAEHAAGQGFDPAVEPSLVFDILLGTAIAHLLANGRPMSTDVAEQLAGIVIRGLRPE